MSALAEWRYVVENRKAGENLILRMCAQKLLASSFYAFQLAVHVRKAAEQHATELADRRTRILHAMVLRGWKVSNYYTFIFSLETAWFLCSC